MEREEECINRIPIVFSQDRDSYSVIDSWVSSYPPTIIIPIEQYITIVPVYHGIVRKIGEIEGSSKKGIFIKGSGKRYFLNWGNIGN